MRELAPGPSPELRLPPMRRADPAVAYRHVRAALPRLVGVILAVALLAPCQAAAAATGTNFDVWKSYSQSWALGVVVPDGAELSGGAALSWADVSNITAVVRLPNITEPAGVTYLVLSAEGDDDAVLQVAVGVWPGGSSWSAYSWYITGLGTSSPAYRWLMNSSTPSMAPGDVVSISTSVREGAWGTGVRDLNTSQGRTGSLPSSTLTRFRSGDQEVFALESYTRSFTTFEDMGNATLLSLSADGTGIVGGWYAYGGWDPAHAPLFEVGSATPPTFVSLGAGGRGMAGWSYDAQWRGAIGTASTLPVDLAFAALAALVPVTFVIGRRLGRRSKEAKG